VRYVTGHAEGALTPGVGKQWIETLKAMIEVVLHPPEVSRSRNTATVQHPATRYKGPLSNGKRAIYAHSEFYRP
jgi:hypothetical protein